MKTIQTISQRVRSVGQWLTHVSRAWHVSRANSEDPDQIWHLVRVSDVFYGCFMD